MYTPHRFSRSLFVMACAAMGMALPMFATAHDLTLGDSSNADVNVTSDQNWTTLRSVVVTINDSAAHSCMTVGSLDIYQPGNAFDIENRYRFVITRNDSNPTTNLGSERMVSLIDNSSVFDADSKPVSTNRVFPNLTSTNGRNGTGEHTFYLLGRKANSTSRTATVEDATLSVVCLDP